jgi:hypothetical protein
LKLQEEDSMSRRKRAKFLLLGSFALAGVECSMLKAAAAADLAIPQPAMHQAAQQPIRHRKMVQRPVKYQVMASQPRASAAERVVTSSAKRGPRIDSAKAADVAERARLAQARFLILRAAMEREMSLHQTVPADELAALDSGMTELSAQLSVVVEAAHSPASDDAKSALALAQDWYQAGLGMINPPPQGATELPLPMNLSNKADLVAAALGEMLEQTVPSASAQPSVKLTRKRTVNGLRATPSSANPTPSYAWR